MFNDRKDAGKRLGWELQHYKRHDPVVLGIPRGGVEVGYWVAKELGAVLSIVVVRKLPFPTDPEAGFGAIAEDGSVFFIDNYYKMIDSEIIESIIKEQKRELNRRVRAFRQGEPPLDINGRVVILVDDGIAMGSTMNAAVKFCRNNKAEKIVVAAPVSAPSTVKEFKRIVDDVVVLEQPAFFRAVSQVYLDWSAVGYDQVVEILQQARCGDED